tara:strand:- start:350 stop:721 length:372 start_codon:yes stop_codon:yes gene_type:complete
MKAGLLLGGVRNGTFQRINAIFWKDIKKGRSVKKFLKVIGDEITIIQDQWNDVIKEHGDDGENLSQDSPNWAAASKLFEEISDQDIELPASPTEITDADLVFVEGVNTYDIEILEALGLLEDE